MTDSSQQTSSGTIHSSSEDGLPAENQHIITTGHQSAGSSSIVGRGDPLADVREILPHIDNESVRHQTENLLSSLHWMIQRVNINTGGAINPPPLLANIDEDGSLMLEWIFPDFRVGFNIEPVAADSGWHLVANKKMNHLTRSGALTDNLIILYVLLHFILTNA
jgi:hypothetical protein